MARTFQMVLAWFLIAATGVFAQDYEKANEAYQAGDCVTAMNEWRLLAAQNNPLAQRNLGYMYDDGDCVPQDYVSAHMWFNLAGGNGHEFSREKRNNVAKRMSSSDIAEAQRRARVCMKSNYTDCE
jgi:TPR repeat protein